MTSGGRAARKPVVASVELTELVSSHALAKFSSESFDLAARVFKRAGAIDFFRGVTQFFFDGKLGGDAAAGLRFAEASREQALELLLGLAPGNDQSIEFFVHARFDKEGGLHKRGIPVAVPLPVVELPEDGLGHARVHNGIETIELAAIGKDECSQFGAVNTAAAVGDQRPEFAEHFTVGGLARLSQLVRQRVGIENGEAHLAEHGRDGALAAGDPAGESESQHDFPGYRAVAVDCVAENLGEARRRRAAFTVLLMSMVMVMGPTPPGTGVSAPAVWMASG